MLSALTVTLAPQILVLASDISHFVQAVLLIGFSQYEVDAFRKFMIDMDADMVKVGSSNSANAALLFVSLAHHTSCSHHPKHNTVWGSYHCFANAWHFHAADGGPAAYICRDQASVAALHLLQAPLCSFCIACS